MYFFSLHFLFLIFSGLKACWWPRCYWKNPSWLLLLKKNLETSEVWATHRRFPQSEWCTQKSTKQVINPSLNMIQYIDITDVNHQLRTQPLENAVTSSWYLLSSSSTSFWALSHSCFSLCCSCWYFSCSNRQTQKKWKDISGNKNAFRWLCFANVASPHNYWIIHVLKVFTSVTVLLKRDVMVIIMTYLKDY